MPDCFTNILLIDDDEEDVVLFRDALVEVSPTTALNVAHSCYWALKQIEDKTFGIPEGIFLDLVMPLMDGVDCVTLFKQDPALKDVPIVVMSSSTFNTTEKLDNLYDLGVSYFISKPPSFSKLKEIIAKMVNTPSMYLQRSKESFYVNRVV